MGTFLGESIIAEPAAPRPSRRHRLESCVVGAIVACLLACVVLVLTRSFWSAGAVIAGSAIVACLRPFPRRGPLDRPALIVWSFYACLVMALVDTVVREILLAMAGHYYYFPRPEREPLIYLAFLAFGVTAVMVAMWLPAYLVARTAAALTLRLHQRPNEPPAPARD